jgi:hypothetical protein
MRKIVALLMAGIMAVGISGCGGSWTTEERDGYSFEVNSGWEKERFSDNTYFYNFNGGSADDEGAAIAVSEYESSVDYNTFGKQSEYFEKMFVGYTNTSNGETFGCRYSDIEITDLGAYAFATYTQTYSYNGEDTVSSMNAEFFVSSNLRVNISHAYPAGDTSKYQADFDRVIESIKLI